MRLPGLHGGAASVILTSTLLLTQPSASAQRDIALTWEAGSGEGVDLWRVGVQLPSRNLRMLGSWVATVAWEAQIGQWAATVQGRRLPHVWDIGVTPLVRLERPGPRRAIVFAEGAVGAHLINRNRVRPGLDMSSAYQFGDHLGVGVRVSGVEVVFRHQHLSNASTAQPNPGVNFNMFRVVYYFR